MIKKILLTVFIVAYTVVMYKAISNAHTYTIPMKPAPTYEEVIPWPEYVEEEPEDVSGNTEAAPVVKSDMQVIAEVVMAEAGNQPLIGKVAVAATLLNRIDTTGRTAESIAREAYSYPYYGVVTNDCYRAVEIAIDNRDLFPEDMFYFRTGHYHNFGTPYVQIGDHYFSVKGES